MNGPLLSIQDLHVHFGALRAVDGVSFTVAHGECFGLVGESGCGKSSLGRAVLRLETVASGRIEFDGEDVASFRGTKLATFRRRAQMIFQDPFGSLNPRLSVGAALDEVLKIHGEKNADRRAARIGELLLAVGLDPGYAARYPHEFSGGQRQRIGIARALAVGPDLLIADEPVSALDVSVQVQILNLMRDLRATMGLTYLFVAHDLAVVRYMCDRVAVMYLGKIVEYASTEDVYRDPRHPYTRALLAAVPDVDLALGQRGQGGGSPSNASAPITLRPARGCLFAPRCPHTTDLCLKETPGPREISPGHYCACHHGGRAADV